jgi:hypothetical protein
MRNDHGPDSKGIGRAIFGIIVIIWSLNRTDIEKKEQNLRLFSPVEKGTRNVARAIPQEEHRIGDNLLRVA